MKLPPGPSNFTIFSNTYKFITCPYQLLESYYKKYGDIYTFKLFHFGQVAVVSDPEVVRSIFGPLGKKFVAGKPMRFLASFIGDYSMLLLDGDEHVRQRRLLSPSFHGEKMNMFADLINQCTANMIQRWKIGQEVMIHKEMQDITMTIIVESVFGQNFNKEYPEIKQLIRDLFNVPAPLVFIPALRFDLWGLNAWGKFLKRLEKIDNLIYTEIKNRQLHPHDEPEDILDMMLLARDEEGKPMSLQELRDECLTLIIGGSESTALSTTWAFTTLLEQPEIIEKIKEELKLVVGSAPLTAKLIPKLTYLDAVFKENMRINSPFALVAREATEDIEIKGCMLPKGTIFFLCNLFIHTNPNIYPEPEKFDPERFIKSSPSAHEWFAFGGGARRCVGMNLAQFEMKMILANVLPNVAMELMPKGDYVKPQIISINQPYKIDLSVKILDKSFTEVKSLS